MIETVTIPEIFIHLKFFFLQILFRVSLTLFMQNKDDILECDDISTLATLLRSMVKDATATNCHEFMDTIFQVPGTLKRTTIEEIRTRIGAKAPK